MPDLRPWWTLQAARAGPLWLWAKVLPISEETGLKVGQDQGRASTPELLPAGLRRPALLSPHWLFPEAGWKDAAGRHTVPSES